MIKKMSPIEVYELIETGHEYALIDVREEGAFSKNRLMLATCLPLSQIEMRCRELVPRKATPLVVMDGGEGWMAKCAGTRLATLSYSNIYIMSGGVTAWESAGFPVYSGVNVMTKAFGEIVYTECHTPDISAEELKRWIDDRRNFLILDSRPFSEYYDHTIPGSISVPGAELVASVSNLVTDSNTVIVVNCAGRTRSIIGCQSLINANVPNKVLSLRNGTMGWKLAGFELEHGATRCFGNNQPDPEQTIKKARALAWQFGVSFICPEEFSLLYKNKERTVFFYDVRTPEVFYEGHAPGARNAPGGQLVQAFDDYVGTRNAVVVLTDPLLLRAVMTASWLLQINKCETYVLDPTPEKIETGTQRDLPLSLPSIPLIEVSELAEKIANSTSIKVLDLSKSIEHRQGHIPGAFWTVRGRNEDIKSEIDNVEQVVLTGSDVSLLRLAAPEIEIATNAKVKILNGGLSAWCDAGHPVETGLPRPIGLVDDVWYKPYELSDAGKEKTAAIAYLNWEVELTEKAIKDNLNFRLFQPSANLIK